MEPLVSILCNTYNHEKYIRDALEGFVMQKTDFPFEVLIHDDASTDKTSDIIREYEEKYPDIVKPIYQTENQYSKKVRISKTYQYPRIRGKYTAVCEGDDYWTDNMKLQKQVDAMEMHPNADICACSAYQISEGKPCGKISPAVKDCVISVQRVISGGGNFVATCSLMMRSDVLKNPRPFRDAFPYDYSLQIQGSLRGGMLYLADTMATYRIFGEGSWSAGYYSDREKRIESDRKLREMLTCLDEETEGRYSEIISYKIKENKFYALNNDFRFKEMLAQEYREVYKKQPFKNKVKIHLRCLFPNLIKMKREKRADNMKKR